MAAPQESRAHSQGGPVRGRFRKGDSSISRCFPGAVAGALTLLWGLGGERHLSPSPPGLPTEAPGGATRAPGMPGGDPHRHQHPLPQRQQPPTMIRVTSSSRSCTYLIGQKPFPRLVVFYSHLDFSQITFLVRITTLLTHAFVSRRNHFSCVCHEERWISPKGERTRLVFALAAASEALQTLLLAAMTCCAFSLFLFSI